MDQTYFLDGVPPNCRSEKRRRLRLSPTYDQRDRLQQHGIPDVSLTAYKVGQGGVQVIGEQLSSRLEDHLRRGRMGGMYGNCRLQQISQGVKTCGGDTSRPVIQIDFHTRRAHAERRACAREVGLIVNLSMCRRWAQMAASNLPCWRVSVAGGVNNSVCQHSFELMSQ